MENIFNGFQKLKLKCLGVQGVLNTEEAQHWAKTGRESGQCPSRRRQVQILGDARVGKTSLRKTLMGENFNPEEDTTKGIETKMCHISIADNKWEEKDIDGDVEYKEALSWYVVRQTVADYMSRSGKYTLKDMFSVFLAAFCLVLLLWYTGYLFSSGVCYLRTFPNWTELWNLYILRYAIIFFGLSLIIGMDAAFIFTGYAFYLPSFLLWFLYKQTDTELDAYTVILLLAVVFLYALASGMGLCDIHFLIVVILTLQAEDDRVCWHVSSPEIEHVLITTLTFGTSIGLMIRAIISMILNIQNVPILEVPLIIIIARFLGTSYLFFLGCLLGWLGFLSFFTGHSIQARIPIRFHKFMTLTLPYIIMVIGYIITCFQNGEVSHISYFAFMFFGSLGLSFAQDKGMLDCFKANAIFGSVILDDLRDKLSLIADMVDDHSYMYITKLPIWLHISDFAGQDIYYNTHHTFMVHNATYIVVFDLTDFVKKGLRDTGYKRILFWLRSIRTHTNSQILLVGTHADQLDVTLVSDIQDYFKSKLSKVNDAFLDRTVWNGVNPFFAIDNRRRISIDIQKLKDLVWKTANESLSVKETHLIRWLTFYNYLNAKRNSAKRNSSSCFGNILMNVEEVKNEFIQTTDDEDSHSDSDSSSELDSDFYQMLEYFNHIGEIVYNSKHPFLRQYVILDKNVIVQAAAAINLIPERSQQGRLMLYWKLLNERGILHFKVAKSLFDKDGVANENEAVLVVLAMLESYNLICKVSENESNNAVEIHVQYRPNYIVPSKLPHGAPHIPSDEYICKYYFDFGHFIPNALFSRLLARCQTSSSLQFETDQSRYLYKEGGEFNLEGDEFGNFYYWLQLNTDIQEQNLIVVSVKQHGGNNPFNLLRYLWQQVEELRKQVFQSIRFHCGAECQWSPPHQMPEEKALHILVEAQEGQPSFPGPSKTFMCRHREVHLNEYRQFRVLNGDGDIQDPKPVQSVTGAPSVNGNHNIMINNPAVVNISERCNTDGVKEQDPVIGLSEDTTCSGSIFDIQADKSSPHLRRRQLMHAQSSK